MKTAVLISGHTRTFGIDAVYRSQKWHVFNQLPDPHFFCSVVNDAQASALDRLIAEYGASHVFIEKIPAQPDCEAELGVDKATLAAFTAFAPYALAPHASPQTILRALWHQQQTWKWHLANLQPELGAPKFDLYVRHRPDLFFHRLQVPEIAPADVCVPYWGSYGGINDRFAIMGHDAARHYFTAYSRVSEMLMDGCPMHPETLSGAVLDSSPVRVRPTLIAEFTGIRLPNAEGKCEAVPAVITEQDHFRHRAALAAGL